jgi:hypothetical protein
MVLPASLLVGGLVQSPQGKKPERDPFTMKKQSLPGYPDL